MKKGSETKQDGPQDAGGHNAAWDAHLARELVRPERAYTFDMDDGPEVEAMAPFGALADAVALLNEEVGLPYRCADVAAQGHQRRHRLLSKVAILSGTLAVMLAIVQLGMELNETPWKNLAKWTEGVAAGAGLLAVIVGLWAKFDGHWFVQRHVAERLRILKFQALGRAEYWCGKRDVWLHAVRSGVEEIRKITAVEDVKRWAHGGKAEPFEPVPPACLENVEVLGAFSDYYRRKRVEFQAAYFGKQALRYRHQARPLAHLGLPLFFMSIVAVCVHFVADGAADAAEEWGGKLAAEAWHHAGVWALVFAAVLPVASLAARAWLGAFEQVRSASLFEAKQRALERIFSQLATDGDDLAATMHHIAHVEHFLEHEHREWLRLMMETEWML